MSGLTELHLTPALAALLEQWGYAEDDAAVREVAATAARGHNVVLVGPPTARHAVPLLAGMLSAFTRGTSRALLLCPAATLDEWAAVVTPLARAAGLSADAGRGPARSARRLQAGLDLLIAAPDTALALLRRSALKTDGITQLFLAWPELFDDAEILLPVMQDLPKDTQRLVHTTLATGVSSMVERYARKALTIGAPPAEGPSPSPAGPVRTVIVPWSGRAAALPLLLESLDPASTVVWAADRAGVAEAAGALPSGDAELRVVTGDAPAADLILAWDLPPLERLRQLTSAGPVVLLAPPHAEGYLARVAHPRTAVRLPGVLEAAQQEAATRRASVSAVLEKGMPSGELLALAPLFERYDPAAVAGALYRLWTERTGAVREVVPDVPAVSKLWIGLGKKDGTTPNDVVAALTREARVDRGKIGKIEVRELYTLVELPARDIEQIAGQVNGLMIRRRRVTARVDRGGKMVGAKKR
ncbi:MAG: DbpA RNA binding domain-containing protein [Gemmatimonadota bacterium]